MGVVSFDLEGAYDATWRHGILLKAFECGIRDAIVLFLLNFLPEIFYSCPDWKSHEGFLQENAVLQSGVISVALFALAMNDVGDAMSPSIGRPLFVDDFAIWLCSLSTPATE